MAYLLVIQEYMLRCDELTVQTPGGVTILDRAQAAFRPRSLNAVIGPSGCGKTTLVKAMIGILPAQGMSCYDGQPIHDASELTGRVGFAPQFSIAQPRLTVEENLRYALELTVRNREERRTRLEKILGVIGLESHRQKLVESLSGGQMRRLGLGLELTTEPDCLVCDEVTSGLDPNSEDAILALLRGLVDREGKSFICIIHNLAKLELFDQVTVVYEGAVVFEGGPQQLNEYFGIPDPLHLYDRLNAHGLEHWRERWRQEQPGAPVADTPASQRHPAVVPGALAQLGTLLRRRARLFSRDRGYLGLTAAITFGFPCLVVIFALGGLPAFENLALEPQGGFLERAREEMQYRMRAVETGALVSGLILFQVILLTLMGANNGGREIAGERIFYEKERLLGLRPAAYGLSKILFTGAVALFQGVWMTWFVKLICGFPGPGMEQSIVLAACAFSMTVVCLGFSAVLGSPEKASLVSIYLVGFQIPLSGIVLALPEALVWVCRPFINAYWAWGGYLKTMLQTRFYDAWALMNPEAWVPDPLLAITALLLQALAGAALVFWGCQRRHWQ